MAEPEKTFRQIALEKLQAARQYVCDCDYIISQSTNRQPWKERSRREAYDRWIHAVIAFRSNANA